MAGTPDGILTHALFHIGVDNVRLNGKFADEIGLWAALPGRFDVPHGLLTGDLAAIREAETFLGKIETVVVKEAASRFADKCLHPQVSQKMMNDAAR